MLFVVVLFRHSASNLHSSHKNLFIYTHTNRKQTLSIFTTEKYLLHAFFRECVFIFRFVCPFFVSSSFVYCVFFVVAERKTQNFQQKINNEQNNRINFRRWFYISLFQFTLLDWHSALERAERFRTLVPRKLAYSRDCLLCVRFLSTEWDLHTAIHSLEVRYRRRRCWRRSKRRSRCVV